MNDQNINNEILEINKHIVYLNDRIREAFKNKQIERIKYLKDNIEWWTNTKTIFERTLKK